MAKVQQEINTRLHWHCFVKKDQIKEYLCAICGGVLDNPHQIVVCGHRFCGLCIKSQPIKKCPTCNKAFKEGEVFLDESIRVKIGLFDVRCPAKCSWKGTFREFQENHKSKCPLKLTSCGNEGCRENVAQRDLSAHQNEECNYRKIDCLHCKSTITPSTKEHHEKECKLIAINCPNCTKPLAREQMKDHVENDCKKTLIDCAFQNIGCNEEIERGEMKEHIERNVVHHLSLTLQALNKSNDEKQSFKDEIAQLRKEVKSVEQKNESMLKQNDVFRKELKTLSEEQSDKIEKITVNVENITNEVKQELEGLQKSTEGNFEACKSLFEQTGIMTSSTSSLQTRVESFQQESGKHSEKFAAISSELQRWRSIVSMSFHRMREKFRKMEENIDKQFQIVDGQNEKNNEEMKTLERKMNQGFEQLDKVIDENHNTILKQKNKILILKDDLDEKYGDVSQQLKCDYDYLCEEMKREEKERGYILRSIKEKVGNLQSSLNNHGSFVWKVDSVKTSLNREPSHAVSGPLFYTEPFGYQVQLKLFFNGARKQDKSYLSLFIKLHPGPYDDILKWPFQQKIRFTLIHHHNHHLNYIRELLPTMNVVELERPTSQANCGYGIYQFIHHKKLQEFVHSNDHLFIRVDVEANENDLHSETI